MIPRAFVLSLPETPERAEAMRKHLAERGLEATFIDGIHGEKFGLSTSYTYDVDNPGTNYHITQKHVGMCLSHYVAWSIFKQLPDPAFFLMEDDCRLAPDWREKLEVALTGIPPDWDLVYIGSCNAIGECKSQVNKYLHAMFRPQCTHAMLISAKAIPILLKTQRRIWAHIDLALAFNSLDQMQVYGIIPRLAEQENTVIPQ